MTKDLGEVFDAHTGAEFEARDVDATMATMSETPSVTHVPVMTGGYGREAVRRFYILGSSAVGRRIPRSSGSRALSGKTVWWTR
jgi:hypothetical protein